MAALLKLSEAQLRWLVSGATLLAATGVVLAKAWQWRVSPWTRDGQVMAQVIEITPRVSGPLVRLPIQDNQFVRKGDLLFEIDPRTFEATLAQGRVGSSTVRLQNARLQEERFRAAAANGSGAVSEIEVDLRVDKRRAAEAALEEALADRELRRLDVEFTQGRAPVDGYVTNLTLRLGSQAVEDEAILALVDRESYWVHGYFRETQVGLMRPGDRAIVTLMTYPDRPLEGVVESIGWGIEPDDGTTGDKLLPQVRPSYEWIRLPERVPVRVALVDPPEDVKLRVAATASVQVLTGTAADARGG